MTVSRWELTLRLLNVCCMGIGWGLAMSGIFVNITTTTVVASEWQGAARSTLPVGLQMLCSALCVVPAGKLAERLGRRPVFITAALISAAGSCVMVAAAFKEVYGLLLLGAFFQGPAFAVANNFRFVSAEFMAGLHPEWRARAISITVGFAVFSAALGPESAKQTKNSLSQPYAGSYVLVVGLYVAQALITGLVSYEWLAKLQQRAVQQQQQQQQAHGFPPVPGPAKGQKGGLPGAAEGPPLVHLNVFNGSSGGHQQGEGGPALPMAVALAATVAGPDGAGAPGVPQAQGRGPDAVADVRADSCMAGSTRPAGSRAVAESVQQQALMPTTGDSVNGQSSRLDSPTDVGKQQQQVPGGAALAPPVGAGESGGGAQSVARRLLRLGFFMPSVAGAVTFCNMAALMVACPVAMGLDNHTFDQSTAVIQGHIISMFLPAMLVGDMIAVVRSAANLAPCAILHLLLLLPLRLPSTPSGNGSTSPAGPPAAGPVPSYPPASPVTAMAIMGGMVMIISDIICLQGTGVNFYAGGLVLLGLGWAMVYVSSSSLVTAIFVCEPALRLAVQSGMDTMVIAGAAAANSLSGPLTRAMGWRNFVFLNLAANAALTLWCFAFHLITARRWRMVVEAG